MKTSNHHLWRPMVLVLVLVVLAAGPGSLLAAPSVQEDADFAPDVVLVRFDPATPALLRLQARREIGAELEAVYSLVPGLEKLRLRNPAADLGQALEQLRRQPTVLYAEPDYTVYASMIPNDPSYGSLWGMANIRAAQAWDVTTGNASFVVADIDTGIDRNHPDLAANMWTNPGETPNNGVDDDGNGYVDDVYGWDWAYGDNDPMDVRGHGSHTGGTIGAVGNNGTGVAGVNWNVKLMALKFLNDSGSGSTSNAIAALNYAVAKGVKVSNNSWGGGSYSQALYDAINNARLINHVFVAAAGNGGADQVGDNNDVIPHYPSSYNLDNIIAVAAITSSDALSGFSNYGPASVDLAAPGSSILSTTPNNSYAYYSGTSMATPHVSGVVALLYAVHPDWTYEQVRDRIFQTVRPLSVLSGKMVTGGTLDAGAALAGATPPPTPTPVTPTATPTATPPATPTTVPTATPTATPTPAGLMNVGDLDGTSLAQRNKWQATVTILVVDQSSAPVANAQVTGNWSSGATGAASCTTAGNGICSVSKGGIKQATTSVTFTVSSVTHASLGYDPSSNSDPDPDSNGTTIIVTQ